MPHSESDLAKEVLRKLRRLDAVEEPDGNDDSYVKGVIKDLHEYLTAQSIASWTLDDIPEKVFHQLAMFCAAHAGPAFGNRVTDVVEGARTWQEAHQITESALRKARAFQYLGVDAVADYI